MQVVYSQGKTCKIENKRKSPNVERFESKVITITSCDSFQLCYPRLIQYIYTSIVNPNKDQEAAHLLHTARTNSKFWPRKCRPYIPLEANSEHSKDTTALLNIH